MASASGRREQFAGRHVRVDYEPDKAGIARCAISNPDLAFAVLDTARKGMEYAVTISPRSRDTGPGHQHYQDSFVIDPGTVRDIGHPPMARLAARLSNISAQATIVEVGAKRTRAYKVLAKTLDHLNKGNPFAQ